MTEQQIAKLREAGFSDADIADYQANESKQNTGNQPVNPAAVTASDLPEVDVTQKSEILKNAEAAGIPTTNQGSMISDAVAIGSAAAPYAVPAALTAGGLYGASVAKQGFNAMKAAAEARTAQAQAQMAQAQGLQQRFDQRMAQRAMTPTSPAGSQILNASGQPMRPVAPAPAPAPAMAQPAPAPATAQQPGILQRGMDYASKMRQVAAQRVLPVAGVPGAVAAGGAAATGIAGGQLAAMTPEQRKAYYDNMMLGAMGGDAALGAAIMNRGQ